MNRIVVYTAIFNDYDWLKDPVFVPDGIDFICYTDSDRVHSKIWKVIQVDAHGESPSLLNRKIKILYPYTVLKDYDYSIYVDGSIMIRGDVRAFLDKYLSEDLVMMNFRHPRNNCLFREIKRCMRRGNADPVMLQKQYDDYKKAGMPEQAGLSDNKVLLRNHHSELGKQLMEDWYDHVANYSGRDQTCLSFVLYTHQTRYSFFDENIEKNPYFETWPHNTVEWYIRYWRHFKWFCERHRLLEGMISWVDRTIKPWLLARIK
jgi:hypothetical protein